MSGERRDCAHPRVRHQHGTKNAYDLDACRCAHCREAHRVDRARRRKLVAYGRWNRTVPTCGTARRIQALHAQGWTLHELGRRLGITPTAVMRLRNAYHPRTTTAVAEKIAALYDELWNIAPPADDKYQRAAVTRIRAIAAGRGWLPPLAYDDDRIDDPDYQPAADVEPDDVIDEIAVLRLMSGALKVGAYQRLPERVEAIRRLAQQGFSDAEIGSRIGQTKEAVSKHRTRNGIPAGVPHGRTA